AISACWSGDGNILISGPENSDDLLMKVDRNGNLIWRQVYPLGMGQCYVTTDSSSAIYTASSTAGPANTDNLVLRKTDSTGTIIWERTYINISAYVASTNRIHIAPNGLLYLATTTASFSISKGLLWSFTPNGDSLWSVTYESTPGLDAYFYHLSPFPGGGFLMSGFADSPTQYNNAWLVRVDSNGCLIPGCLTSVEELEQVGSGGLQLMPNPANERVTIILPEQETGAVMQVYDVAGKLLLEQTLMSQHNFVIDCSVWHNGMYFVNVVTTEGKRFTGKFSVVH
ncbi:MAG: T9SS type A sorting domain-containing protein, partial [Bacteroidia bacterium]|nr:T9SS type A sorting domain-containing protein [Bacteroidia bacterium]